MLVVVALLSVAGCADTQSELQSKIDELQSRIEDLQSQNEDLNAKLAEMQDQINEKDKRIEDLMGIKYRVAYEGQYGRWEQKNYISICNSNNELMQL